MFSYWQEPNLQGKNFIFLLGNQGDGITFISRMLRRNSEVISVSGDSNYWTGADEIQTVFELLLPRRFRSSGRIINTEPYHKEFKPPRSWTYATDDLVSDYYLNEEDTIDAERLNFRRCLALIYRMNGSEKKFFIDKSQTYTLKSRLVQEYLGRDMTKFVFILRNPYVTCFRAAIGKAGDFRRYKHLSLEEKVILAIQHWRNSLLTIEKDREFLTNIYFVRFEDIVNDIDKEIRKISSFCNLKFSEDMLPSEHHKIPFGTKYTTRWFPVRVKSNQSYLDNVPEDIINLIYNSIGELAEKYGYSKPIKVSRKI